jgi:hypothetical protein
MTETNLNLVLTNALCCSSKLAVEVADLYAMNNKCADSEFAKLKLLIDRIEALKCYNFTVDKIYFDNYEDAKAWGKNNLDNFNLDLIKYEK